MTSKDIMNEAKSAMDTSRALLDALTTDRIMSELDNIGITHLNAKTQALEELLAEIELEGYDNIHQVKGCINSELDALNKLKRGTCNG